jgi:hypothetical protein
MVRYDGIKLATNELKISLSVIYNSLKKGTRTRSGYIFEYADKYFEE